MADVPVLISHQLSRPIKILKWKVNEGSVISIGRVMFLFDFDGPKITEQRKLKSTQAGTVHRLIAQEGAIVNRGDILLELCPCIHPTVMNDMCGECGADLRKDDLSTIASIPMVHSIPELKVSEELAQKIGKADGERLLKDRKLVLLVDLDQTIIHTTNDNIPPNIRDVYHFQLYGSNSPWYHTRLRPGTHDFLNNVSSMYELHICTFGARNYAHTITMLIDRDQRYFSNRILSRDECFDPTSKKANLKALFPCGDNMVCIIDDREDVWSHATNLIHVKPYHFFQHTGDINAPPGLDKQENDDKEGVDLTKIKSKNKTSNGKSEEEDVEAEEILEDADTKETASNHGVAAEENEKEGRLEKPVPSANDVDDSNADGTTKDGNNPNAVEDENNATALPTENGNLSEGSEMKSENVTQYSDKSVRDDDGDDSKKSTAENLPNNTKKDDEFLEIEDPDDYLLYLEDILKKIHRAFYLEYDQMECGQVPDLKRVIPAVRGRVLDGCNLVFSGLVPTHIKLVNSKAYQVAKSLGANVTQDLQEDTTHLVAVRPGTAKVNAGRRRKNIKIVTPDWLWTCAERWEHVDEVIYPLNRRGSKNRHPPPHCSSPEHVPSYPVHDTPAVIRRRTPSGRFMDTINPLMSFSSDDIADMDKEVDNILDDESDSDDEQKMNKASLTITTGPSPVAAAAATTTTTTTTTTDVAKGTTRGEFARNERENIVVVVEENSESSSGESLTGEYPRGFKRSRDALRNSKIGDAANFDDLDENSSLDEFPSVKFRRGEKIDSDLDMGDSNSERSLDPPDDIEDGEWNMMGAALEREFLSNN